MLHGLNRRRAVFALLLGAGGVMPRAAWGQRVPSARPDTIRGIVELEGTASPEGLVVSLTRAPELTTRSVTVGRDGRFAFVEMGGAGEYMLAVTAPGYRPVRRRIPVPAERSSRELHVFLTAWTATLATITATARRIAPERPSGFVVGAGASEGLADGSPAAGSPSSSRLSDLLVTSLAGTSSPRGWSVAGLDGSESQVQLNGMLFRGEGIPRSLPRRIRLSATNFDIANGGFSGGLVGIEIPRAPEFASVNVDLAGRLDPAWRVGQPSPHGARAIVIDAGGSARNASRRRGVTFGGRAEAREEGSTQLETASDSSLRAAGVDPALVRAADALLRTRMPALPSRSPALRHAAEVNGFLRFDPAISDSTESALLLSVGHTTRDQDAGISLASRGQGWSERSTSTTAQWLRSWAGSAPVRWDWRNAITLSSEARAPWLPGMPTIEVGTRASLADSGYWSIATLGGGAPADRSWRAVVESMLQRDALVGRRGAHRLRLVLAARTDALRREAPSATATVGFSTLGALQRSVPDWRAAVTGPGAARAHTVRLAAGVGDEWRASPRVRVEYGLRADAQRLRRPGWVDSVGGPVPLTWSRTHVALSPRVGLSWQLRPRTEGEGFAWSPIFSRHLVPAGVLHMGAGIFHRDLEPDMALHARSMWGPIRTAWCGAAAGGVQRWDPVSLDPREIAQACAGAPSETAAAPLQQVLAGNFSGATSARGSVALLLRIRGIDLEAGALWNRTTHLRGIDDLSIQRTPLSWLPGEGERAFFAPRAAIDSVTGLVRPGLGRVAFGGVQRLRASSDRRSRAEQYSVQVSPRWADSDRALRLGYTWGRARALEGGRDRDAFGDPVRLDWGPALNDRRHQLQIEAGLSVHDVTLALWARAMSGAPYTPIVAGDVNGDGDAANDRAFLPTPGTGALSARLDAMLAAAPARVRGCLERQRGSAASRGSCRGPWTMQSTLVLGAEPKHFGSRRRGAVTLAVENVAALADQLLHRRTLRGWGSSVVVDPVLLRARGFTAATGGFAYEVNPAFGRPLPGARGDGTRLTLTVSMPVSAPVLRQQVERWMSAHGVGERLPADTMATRFARNVPPLYAGILEAADDLLLSPAQVQELERRERRLHDRIEARWRVLATTLSRFPRRFDVDSATSLVDAAVAEVWELNRQDALALATLLTPIQQLMLPSPAKRLVSSTRPVTTRITYY